MGVLVAVEGRSEPGVVVDDQQQPGRCRTTAASSLQLAPQEPEEPHLALAVVSRHDGTDMGEVGEAFVAMGPEPEHIDVAGPIEQAQTGSDGHRLDELIDTRPRHSVAEQVPPGRVPTPCGHQLILGLIDQAERETDRVVVSAEQVGQVDEIGERRRPRGPGGTHLGALGGARDGSDESLEVGGEPIGGAVCAAPAAAPG